MNTNDLFEKKIFVSDDTKSVSDYDGDDTLSYKRTSGLPEVPLRDRSCLFGHDLRIFSSLQMQNWLKVRN